MRAVTIRAIRYEVFDAETGRHFGYVERHGAGWRGEPATASPGFRVDSSRRCAESVRRRVLGLPEEGVAPIPGEA